MILILEWRIAAFNHHFTNNKIGKLIKKMQLWHNLQFTAKHAVASYMSQIYNICDRNYTLRSR